MLGGSTAFSEPHSFLLKMGIMGVGIKQMMQVCGLGQSLLHRR